MKRLLGLVVVALVVGCGPVEIRIDETRGVPPIAGSTVVSVGTSVCGQPIVSGDYTITTAVVTGGCQYTFDQTVPVLKVSDYESIPELRGATNLVKRVELTVKKLAITDGSTGASVSVTSASLWVDGQKLADESVLTKLPTTVTLSGSTLDAIKAKVDARQPFAVAAKAVVVVPATPPPPASMRIEYDAQPAFVVGTGKLF